jgi:hypothetical protein
MSSTSPLLQLLDLMNVPEGYYVFPGWASGWNDADCSVVSTIEDGWAVVDNKLQITIYVGTKASCERVLGSAYTEDDATSLRTPLVYNMEDWLTDNALQEGVMISCPDCGESYWSEDGHPEGTLCPKFGINTKPKIDFAGRPNPRILTCRIHNIEYWWEDSCPKCDD